MFAAFLAAAVAVGLVTAWPLAPEPPTMVTVDAASATGTIETRLGTQFVWPGTLDRSAAARARFTTLAPPLVRINATTIGSERVLPAGVARGDWSFGSLDSMVNDIRRAGGQVLLAVDPSIKLVGPATANATTASDPDYLPALMSRASRKPDIVSFHGYGGWLSWQTDQFLFLGGDGSFGLDGIERGLARVKAWAPGIPVWITGLNVNSASDQRRETRRAWDAFGAAWGASAFRRLALGGAGAVSQYQFTHPGLRQFSLVDSESAGPLLPYWRDYYLARYFPPGSTVLSSSSSLSGVETLAVRPPGSANVNVLVVNRQLDSATAVGGPGLPAAIRIKLKNLKELAAVTVRSLDASTPLETGPAAIGLPAGGVVDVNFAGYGAALLEFVAHGVASS